MSQERPAAVAAVWLTRAQLVLLLVAALLAVVLDDELADAWQSGRPDADSVEPPSIVPVVVVMLAVIGLLLFVLLEFFRSRHGWARVAITVTLVLLALGTLATLRIGPPALFVVVSVLSLALDVAIIGALWRRDTTGYLREADRSHDVRAGS
ncbi:hypothetical protein GON03_19960 [Nocardioides sp. MAH-18]|uniref:DUF2127 domain-containing protein n=1 Tax=Nocardioides agri TaxID=2682843 RepID=A0A6L6XVQ1_9ACTN|nr:MULTISPECIES: hypothetical protein [unclassified Nocardioides]MBA2952299.1 hypothetical protein [Nocardioides sp. CGMCC 1.13656]MVQ51461.1 hypothetical protein [Nocardioides sp. MAH-18]